MPCKKKTEFIFVQNKTKLHNSNDVVIQNIREQFSDIPNVAELKDLDCILYVNELQSDDRNPPITQYAEMHNDFMDDRDNQDFLEQSKTSCIKLY
jgi:hypothetical protein